MCVWKSSGEHIEFTEVSGGYLSGITSHLESNRFVQSSAGKYKVETISLSDLLNKYNAPQNIDYLSLDTEGSEFEILNSFDFNRFSVRLITCEHNNIKTAKQNIRALLEGKGYRRIMIPWEFEDWFVLEG
jgi:FkbM family methyltransferase